MAMRQLACNFEPMDTWFFRDSRPQGSFGASEMGSVFPPPVRTLLGAVRTAIGDAWHAKHGSNWRDFEDNAALRAVIGFGDDLGNLRVQGPWLVWRGQRLYPAPLNLMHKSGVYFLMPLGNAVRCDLGTVRLPVLPARVKGLEDLAGAKPVEGAWLTQKGWASLLQGQAPSAADVVSSAELFLPEPRLGIGRDNARGAVTEGMLYQTRHLRMADGLQVGLSVVGLSSAPQDLGMPAHLLVRLGGEGRQAMFSLQSQDSHADAIAPVKLAVGDGTQPTAMLYNVTANPCAPGQPAGIPAGFERKSAAMPDGADVWEGQLGDVRLRIFAAVTGRAVREGGWDLARHQSRAVQSLTPAGSALYVTSIEGDLNRLHDQAMGEQSQWGRGHYLVGNLPEVGR